MASKNNPENRGRITELRQFAGKEVKPVLLINGRSRFIAAMYGNGDLVVDGNGNFIPYKNV